MRALVGCLVLMTTLLGCGPPPPRVPSCGDDGPNPTRILRADPRALTCDDAPELCNVEVQSNIRLPHLPTAFDIVFIPEGFEAKQLPFFHDAIDTWMADFTRDEESIVGRAPHLFNVHKVILPVPRGENTVGGCATDGFPLADSARVALAARNAPDVDVVVVVFNADLRFGNASVARRLDAIGIARVGRTGSAGHLDHELSHALAGLGDEYSREGTGCAPLGNQDGEHFGDVGLTGFPNLSSQEGGALWAGLVDGTEPGGSLYEDCIWHPAAASCRMDVSASLTYCPVCDAHIDRVIAKQVAGFDEEPAKCSLQLRKEELPDGRWQIVADVRGYSLDGLGILVSLHDDEQVLIGRGFTVTPENYAQASVNRNVAAGDYTLRWGCNDLEMREVPFTL